MTLYWLSFADSSKPRHQQWLGGAFIEVDGTGKEGLQLAIEKAWHLGINPGGQIKSFEVPADSAEKTRLYATANGSFEQLIGRAWLDKHGEKV